MFTKTKITTRYDSEIDVAVLALSHHAIGTETHQKVMDQLVRLHKMKEDELPTRVSPDTLALITANLIGIIMVVRHEHINVITTKAMSMVMKPR